MYTASYTLARHAPLEGEDKELGVVLVVEGREGDGPVVARLQPVHLW